jgi:hypothetical protein
MSKFEGEPFMPQQHLEQEQEIGSFGVIARGQLGEKNLGYFGPNSEREAKMADYYADPEYRKPPTDESYCMDDRFEGFGIQLPGNRALAEIAGIYTDGSAYALPLSRITTLKVRELVDLGHKPVFHGDEASGKKGCAANLNLRATLAYNAENSRAVSNLVRNRLRMLGVDNVRHEDLRKMIEMGGARAADDSLWDVDAEGVVDIATTAGAGYIEFRGAHHTAGVREDMTESTFDNGAFRANFKTDDDHPAGALSLTYGAYLKQLIKDKFTEEEISKKISGVLLYSVSILKLATKDEAVDVVVGYGVVD